MVNIKESWYVHNLLNKKNHDNNKTVNYGIFCRVWKKEHQKVQTLPEQWQQQE